MLIGKRGLHDADDGYDDDDVNF